MSLKKPRIPKYYPNKALNRCAYKNCSNRRGDEGIILFCFPNRKTNIKKYEKWCQNSGVKKENTTWRLMICNTHFHGEDYTTYEHQKLLSRAIPIDYRLNEKDLCHPFDPTKVEKVYANNTCKNILNIIKTEIKEEDSDSETDGYHPFDPEKVKRVYTCKNIMNIIKTEIIENDSNSETLLQK
ncbi:uncharacterized protein LOC127286051 [Leptopilina boulardi]|uniref:uncharacterized protein LOC127286051 n=1 Tax=Leptopilina boulardi TaxID=63433 RepID=UPI0021F5DD5E|nr:uncharacterized protein LOC127286051 [Leptopilina boulardi]